MQNIVFYVSGAETLGTVRDYANAKTLTAPVLVRGVETCLKMRLFANPDGTDPYPISSFNNVVAWQFVMDKDFNSSTGYILEADDDNIVCETVTDTINEETITYTQFSIPIPGMNTEALVNWLNSEESKSGLNAELIGFDGSGEQVFVLQVKGFVVRGRISSLGEPSSILPEYLSASQVRALVASGVVFQFSTDATNWHDVQTSSDVYYRQRSASSATSTWSAPVLIVKGAKGEDGRVVTGAGEINVNVSGGTATLVCTMTGGTTFVPVSDDAIVLPESFLDIQGRCEFDLINSAGKNITTDPAVSRQWLADGYKVKIASGLTGGQYVLKPAGVRGEKGDNGRDGFEDYTAFEVIANAETIPAGSLAYKGIDLSTVVGGNTLATAVEIPIGMEHEFKAWVINDGDVRVEWGDGVTENILAVDSIATCNHTYAQEGKYLVKVYGDFVRIITTSTKNLIHRVLDEGLPLARHHNSLQGFAQNALRLVAVDVPGWGKCAQIESLLNTFSGCKNLRSVSGLSRIPHLVSCNSAFKDCWNMVSCDFRLPPVMLNQPGGSDAYRAVFYSSMNVNWALTSDVSAFFPDGGFAGDYNDLTQLFYNYRADVRYPNMTLSNANAAKLARILWESGKRFVYRSASDEVGGQSGIFRCMPATVREKIPVAWGGTNSEIVVDQSTGCMSEVTNYSFDDAFSVTAGTVSLNPSPVSSTYILVSEDGLDLNAGSIVSDGVIAITEETFASIFCDRTKLLLQNNQASLYTAGANVSVASGTITFVPVVGNGILLDGNTICLNARCQSGNDYFAPFIFSNGKLDINSEYIASDICNNGNVSAQSFISSAVKNYLNAFAGTAGHELYGSDGTIVLYGSTIRLPLGDSTPIYLNGDVLSIRTGFGLSLKDDADDNSIKKIGLSEEYLNIYGENFINIGGGTANKHPNSTLVVGENNVGNGATNSVVCGGSNICSNSYSTMFGYQLISSSVQFQTVVGRSNKQDTDAYFIVGNGTSSQAGDRKNAFVVKKSGNGVFAGDVLCNGGTVSVLGLLARIQVLEAQVIALGGTITQ